MVKTKTPSLNETMKRAKNEQSSQFVEVKVTKPVTIVAIILEQPNRAFSRMKIHTKNDHIKVNSIDHIFNYYCLIFRIISSYNENLKLTMGDIEVCQSISPSVKNLIK